MHHENDLIDAGTTVTGGLLAFLDGGASPMTLLGLAIGLGGFLCGLSREVRAWLDRRAASRQRSTK